MPGYSVDDPIEDQYLAVVNYLRGLRIKCNDTKGFEGPVGVDLQWNGLLEDAAQEHSDDMAKSAHFDHLGSGTENDITGQTFDPPRQSTVAERIERAGYQWTTYGENIAMRWSYPDKPSNTAWVRAMEDWMKSKTGHCSNIMNPDFRDFGMAESRGVEEKVFSDGNTYLVNTAYWTQNFGAQ